MSLRPVTRAYRSIAVRSKEGIVARSATGSVFLRNLLAQGISPIQIGIFCRSNDQITRASKIAELAGVKTNSSLGGRSVEEAVLIGTMHFAKGLEFRAFLSSPAMKVFCHWQPE